MNSVNLTGRLTWAPEIKMAKSGKEYSRFSIAVQRMYSESGEADFIKCLAFGPKADLVQKHLHKGDKIGISGRLQMCKFEIDGQTRISYFVVVDQLEFLSPKHKDQSCDPCEDDEILDDIFPF